MKRDKKYKNKIPDAKEALIQLQEENSTLHKRIAALHGHEALQSSLASTVNTSSIYEDLMKGRLENLATGSGTHTYAAEPHKTTFPKYKSTKEEDELRRSYAELLDVNYTLFGNYVRDREKSLKEEYILEIVKCFKRAFEEIYSNDCPKKLLELCKQHVGNFVKSLDDSTKM